MHFMNIEKQIKRWYNRHITETRYKYAKTEKMQTGLF